MLHRARLLEKQRIIAREEAAPAVDKLLHLLLRGGVYGLLEFAEHELPKGLEPPSGRTRRRGNPPDADVEGEGEAGKGEAGGGEGEGEGGPRLNPESLRAALKRCGVLLSQPEHRRLLRAFSDGVGFVRAAALREAVRPLPRLPAAARGRLEAALRVDGGGAAGVTRRSVVEGFLPALLARRARGGAGGGSEGEGEGSPDAAVEEILRADLAEAGRCFAAEKFPDGVVPLRALRLYLEGLLFLYGGPPPTAEGAAVAAVVMDRLGDIARAAPPLLVSARPLERVPSAALALPSGAAPRDRLFERYEAKDRRDEWLRGRDERAAREPYLRHVVGYTGHLPAFRHHFGRTFHVIEEDLPQLTRPRSPKPPLPLDAYGPAIKLKHNRMCEHHFKFS